MLSLTVPENIHGSWGVYDFSPEVSTEPQMTSSSPNMAISKEVLPQPTEPTTATNSPWKKQNGLVYWKVGANHPIPIGGGYVFFYIFYVISQNFRKTKVCLFTFNKKRSPGQKKRFVFSFLIKKDQALIFLIKYDKQTCFVTAWSFFDWM